jgi:hypothetical protein
VGEPLSRPGRCSLNWSRSHFPNRLSCCGVAARSPRKGRLLHTHSDLVANLPISSPAISPAGPGMANDRSGRPPAAVSPASATNKPESGRSKRTSAARDEQLLGAEITFGGTLIGHVEGLVRDPLSQRVRRLITSYGLKRRRVAVPMEWVVKRSDSGVVLAVGARSLDDLGDRSRP